MGSEMCIRDSIYTRISKNAQHAVQYAIEQNEERYAQLIQEGANSVATDEARNYTDAPDFHATLRNVAGWCNTEQETYLAQLGALLHHTNSIEATIENWFKTHCNQIARFNTPRQALDAFFVKIKTL